MTHTLSLRVILPSAQPLAMASDGERNLSKIRVESTVQA